MQLPDPSRPSVWSDLFAVAALLSCAVMLAMCFTDPNLAWLAFVALVPWAWSLQCRASRLVLYPTAFLAAFFVHPLALDWFHGAGTVAWLGSLATVKGLYLSIVLSGIWTAMFAMARTFVVRLSIPMAVALPLTWLAGEFARRYIPAIIDGGGFPWLQLGHTQIDQRTLVQIADLGGVWAVTAVVAMVNGAIFDVLRLASSRRFARVGVVVGMVALALGAVHLYGAWRIASTKYEPGPVVCLMPSHIVADLKPEHAAGADLLLWSETAVGGPLVLEGRSHEATSDERQAERAILQTAFDHLADFSRSTGTSLAVGCVRLERLDELKKFNSVAFFSGGRGFAGCYDKVRPVPWGEFVPTRIPGLPRGGKNYRPGSRYPIFHATGRDSTQWRVATTICYDTCFPEVYGRHMRADGGPPDIFITASSEPPDRGGLLNDYLLALTRFRAIETRRTQARCVNFGWSGLVTSLGDVAVQARGSERRVVLPPAPVDRRKSFYARWGDAVPLGAWSLAVATIVVWSVIRKKIAGISLPPLGRA